jgi:predicted Zn-dependent protease
LPDPGTQWQFHIIENDSPNAFALPGGHILVCTGLLRLASPEEVLGTVAHEVAHVTQKHGFRMQVASAGPLLAFQIFLRGRVGALGVLAGGSALLVRQSFSQEYEKEADDAGWQYLVNANINPRAMIDLFRKLETDEAKNKGADWFPQAFNSHPELAKRISRLEAKWKKLPRKSGFLELNPGPTPER